MGAQHRKAGLNHARDQFIDEAVLGTAQSGDVEPAIGEEVAWIYRTAMGRIKQDRPPPRRGLNDFKRRIELVADFAHEEKAIAAVSLSGSSGALRPHCTVYCSWLSHKAKSWFRFTRYLPGISLNRPAEGGWPRAAGAGC